MLSSVLIELIYEPGLVILLGLLHSIGGILSKTILELHILILARGSFHLVIVFYGLSTRWLALTVIIFTTFLDNLYWRTTLEALGIVQSRLINNSIQPVDLKAHQVIKLDDILLLGFITDVMQILKTLVNLIGGLIFNGLVVGLALVLSR